MALFKLHQRHGYGDLFFSELKYLIIIGKHPHAVPPRGLFCGASVLSCVCREQQLVNFTGLTVEEVTLNSYFRQKPSAN